jgi:hypothetical protein
LNRCALVDGRWLRVERLITLLLDFCTFLNELASFLFHPGFQCLFLGDARPLRGVASFRFQVSSGFCHWLAILHSNQRQTQAKIFRADLARSTAQRTAGRRYEVVLGFNFTSSAHGKSIRCNSAGAQVRESARSSGGFIRLSQSAQRAADFLQKKFTRKRRLTRAVAAGNQIYGWLCC